MTEIRVVAFDLDDTLAESKSAVEPAMTAALLELIERRPVCVISGGRFEQFDQQLLRRLPASPRLTDLHLMPTCGTRYLRWQEGDWELIYAHDLTEEEKSAAITAITDAAKDLGYWGEESDTFGERIEDRGSQITYSALGQEAPVALKKAWDPDGSKRELLRAAISAQIPQLEVRAGGSTSIDVTTKGVDKAYGMRKLAEILDVAPEEILFIGDRLEPGGNDYPVVAVGVQTHAVSGPAETLTYVQELLPRLA